MTVWEVFAEYDKNATIMNDQELEVWLNETLSAFQQEHPTIIWAERHFKRARRLLPEQGNL